MVVAERLVTDWGRLYRTISQRRGTGKDKITSTRVATLKWQPKPSFRRAPLPP